MTDLTRRGFLKAGLVSGALLALGRLPSVALPAAELPPVVLAEPAVQRASAMVFLSSEVLEDSAGLEAQIHGVLADAFWRDMAGEL